LRLGGIGGVPNGTLRILGSNSLSVPVANWTQLGTGNTDANGNFAVGLPLPATMQFFVVQSR
jgi:hypothetical protein